MVKFQEQKIIIHFINDMLIYMWTDYIKDIEALERIYNGKMPSLTDISFHEFVYSPGRTKHLSLSFITNELPNPMPSKWKASGVNSILISIDVVLPVVKYFGLDMSNYEHLVFDVYAVENQKIQISIKNSAGNLIIDVEGCSAYIRSWANLIIGEDEF